MENEQELELELDLDKIETDTEKKLQVKDRFSKLTEKSYETAKERDDALAKVKTEEEARAKAEKERDFFKNFNQVSTKYPGATDFQDKILEKVNSGYELEDATVAILNREGKLNAQPAYEAPVRRENPAGGSAATTITDSSPRGANEMTREEMRKELIQRELSGDLKINN